MMKNVYRNIVFYLIMGLMLSGLQASAQRVALKGFIYDGRTGQAVPYATVSVEGSTLGTSSDVNGYYHLEGFLPGTYDVQVRCVGYLPLSETIRIDGSRPVVWNVEIEPEAVQLHEVNVSAAREARQREDVGISEINIIPAEITMTPTMGGIPDLIQRLQIIPGVVSRGDIGGQIYIRGGTPVQNKMLLDESVIYNPVHSIGMFTVFDNDYIQNVDFHTGGFSAEYGGCISSVVNVNTRYGNTRKFSGRADLSTIMSKLFIEGPLFKDSSMESSSLSFMLSVKNAHFIQGQKWFYPYLDQELPFNFLDIYSKFTLLAGKSLRVNLYGYNSNDRVGYSGSPAVYSWKATGFGGDIQLYPPRASMSIKAYFAGSFYTMTLEEQSYDPRFSNIDHLSFGFRFKRYLPNQTINYGLELMNLTTDYSYFSNPFNDFEQRENSTEISGYLQYHADIGRFLIDPGLRFQHYATLAKSSFEPRLLLKFSVLKNFRLKAAGGLYTQNLISAISDRDIVNFFHGFLSAPVSLVNDGEKPVSDYYLQKSQHYIAGAELDFFSKLFVNLEYYYKYYPQLINFNKYKILSEEQHPELPKYLTRDFILESGFAQGLELSILYDDQFRRLELGYTYAVTKRKYDDPEKGVVEYYPQYDRRHNLNLSGSIRFGRGHNWEANAHWSYGSGFPFTPSMGYCETVMLDENANINHLTSNGSMGILYGDYNAARLPDYHRLDMAVKKRFPLKGHSLLEAEFTVINVYDHENVFYTDRKTNEQVNQLPVLPSLRVSMEF